MFIADEAMRAAHINKAENSVAATLEKQRNAMLQNLEKARLTVAEKNEKYQLELQKANQFYKRQMNQQGQSTCLECAINPVTMTYAPGLAIGAAFAGQFMDILEGESYETK